MAPRLDLKLDLNGPQFAAFDAIKPRRTVFCGWGRGIGKSHFTRQQAYLRIAEWEHRQRPDCPKRLTGARCIALMPTLKQFKDVHLDGLRNELGPGGQWDFLGAKINESLGQVTFPGGSWIRPFPAQNHSSKGARGMRGDMILGDEIDDIDAGVYYSVAIPWLSEPWSLGIELLSGTPTRGRHGLWWLMHEAGRTADRLRRGLISRDEALSDEFARDIIELFSSLPAEHYPPNLPTDPEDAALQVLKSFYSFHATYRDAPETVSPLAVARAKRNTPRATFEREWEANPDAGEGLVYPEFDRDFHVRQPPDRRAFNEFIVGADFGAVDPGVLLLVGIQGHGNDATAWVLEEHYESNCLNRTWDERAVRWRGAAFYPDPSRLDRIQDWRALGLDVREIPADVKPIRAGLARVADLMHRRHYEGSGAEYARLYVAPQCKNLIREFGLYRHKKNKDDTFSEEPEDKNNHTMDALRYCLASRFGRVNQFRTTVSGR